MSETARSDEHTFGMLCHLSALLGYPLPGLGALIGPLLVWLWKRDSSSFVDDQGKESLNFQITMLLAFIVSIFLALVLIGFLFLWLIPIVDLIFIIVASIKAANGERYRYPFCLRLIK